MSGGDPLGNAIQDHAMGQAGMLTGNSAINVIGYNQYANDAYGPAPGGRYRRGGRANRPYVMTPILRRVLDAIPLWVHLLLAAVLASGMALGLTTDGTLLGLAGGWVAITLLSLGAGMLGFIALPLFLTLVDLTWKLCVGMVYLFLAGLLFAAAGGVLYAMVTSIP